MLKRIGLFNLLRTWWQIDRIRASPLEGRLLRLRPSTLLSVQGRYYCVLTRSVSAERHAACVYYALRDEGCRENRDEDSESQHPRPNAELRVMPLASPPDVSVIWVEAGRERELNEHEVEVFD